jgi:hypothetical protein
MILPCLWWLHGTDPDLRNISERVGYLNALVEKVLKPASSIAC